MPTLQVIQRQEDPDYKLMSEFGKGISDTIQKRQSLELTGRYYGILAKNAETEIDKLKYEKYADTVKNMLEVNKIEDPQKRAMSLKMMMDAKGLDFGSMADVSDKAKEYMDLLSKPTDVEAANLSKTQAEGRKIGAEADMLDQVRSRINAVGGGGVNGGIGIPPGTTLNAGGLNMPLNPRLTDTEQGSVSGAEKFEPLVDDISTLIRGGALGKGSTRMYNQMLADGGQSAIARTLTKDDSKLETLSSKLAELKKYAFSEGGKTLSPTELQVVQAGLSMTGKGDKQAVADIQEAIRILKSKRKLALEGAAAVGGSNAGRVEALGGKPVASGFNPAEMSDEELERIANGG